MTEQLDSIKSILMSCVASRMSDLENTDTKELGEVIDMIKDLEEAKYYCAITKAMELRDENDVTQEKIDKALLVERLENQNVDYQSYYGGPYVRYPDKRFDDYGRMYYDGRDMPRSSSGINTEKSYTQMSSKIRDSREGRSWNGRRGYMEAKEIHESDAVKLEKLEEYIRELGEDITDMISDATPQEKNTLRDKLAKLAQRVV